MNIIECEEHKMTKRYLVCLDENCKDRLICWLCHQKQNHHDNNYMDEMIVEYRNELKDIFNDIMNETSDIANSNEQFIRILKDKIKKILSERN